MKTPTAAHTLSPAELDKLGDLTEFTERSIREHADFRDDIERLSTADSRTRKALRKEIYDTIDARVRNAVKVATAAQARAALTGQATAPAQAAPSEQDERALFKARMILEGWTDEQVEAGLRGDVRHFPILYAWNGWERRAAQGASAAPTEPFWAERIAENAAAIVSERGAIAKAYGEFDRLRKLVKVPGYCCGPKHTEHEAFSLAVSAITATSGASGTHGEPTGATGAAGGEERAGYCADCNSWGGEHGEGCQRRPERFSRTAASQAAPGEQTEAEYYKTLWQQARAENRRLSLPSLAPPAGAAPELTVWYGPMPESNGRHNYTAVLHRADAEGFDIFTYGFQFARSEYPDRVRHEADFMLWLIGQRAERPELWDACYDMDKHSGYAAAHAPVVRADVPADLRHVLEMARQDLTMNRTLKARDRVVEALAMLAASPSPSAPQGQDDELCEDHDCPHVGKTMAQHIEADERDAARFRFMLAAADHPDGPEYKAMGDASEWSEETYGDFDKDKRQQSAILIEMIDRARAAMSGHDSANGGERSGE